MIGERQLLARQRVDARRHFLRLRAIVDENDCRSRVAHVTKHERCDRGPDRTAGNMTKIFDR